MDYLEEVYPNPSLLPDNPAKRAQTKAAAQIITADIAPIQNLRVLKFIRAKHDQEDAGVKRWAAHWIAQGFKSLELIAQKNSSVFFMQGNPGYFECCLVPQVYNAHRFGVNMDDFPKLLAIHKSASKHPAFIKAAPEHQQDAVG